MKPSNFSKPDSFGGEWLPRAWRRVSHPWVRWTLAVVSVLGLAGVFAVGAVWRHYAREAEKFDLAGLQHLIDGTQVTDRDGHFVGTLFANGRKFVRLEDVPPSLVDAVLATEDSRFYQHKGVDLRGIARAALANGIGPVKQGGSTLTQQLARQAFGLRGRTYDRKLTEICLARRIERHCTKQEILCYYLNHVYLGSGFYGVGAAAKGYFGKEARDLTLEESAILAGIIKSPVRCSPFDSPQEAKRVRDLTLGRMAAVGKLSTASCKAAQATAIEVLPRGQRHGRPDYLLAAAERSLTAATPGIDGMMKRRVRLTVDASLQRTATAKLAEQLEKARLFCSDAAAPDLQAAAVVIANDTGEILASVGGRDFRESPFDRALVGRWPAGTAFLPLTHAAAYSVSPSLLSTKVLDAPLDNRQVMIGGRSGILGEWGAEDEANRYEGWMAPTDALIDGKTGASVRIGLMAGFERVREQLGFCDFSQPLRTYPSMLLGSSRVRPVDLAQAYAALANGGIRPPSPSLVTSVDAGGLTRTMGSHGKTAVAFSAEAAAAVRDVLVEHLERPEFRAELRRAGLPSGALAGYGGTSYGFSNAWFAGSDARVTCVVWFGSDKGRRLGPTVWARQIAFPLWCDLMAAATKGQPLGFPQGGSTLANRTVPTGSPESRFISTGGQPTVATPTRSNGRLGVRAAEPAVVGEDPYRPAATARPRLVMRAEPADNR